MVDGVKNGTAPKAVTTYMEQESRRACPAGKYAFMRNWPYAYALGKKGPQGQGQVQGHPVPDLRGRRQGRHPRRPQHRDLRLLEEPGAAPDVHRLLRVTGRSRRRCLLQVLAGADASPRSYERAGRQEGAPVRAPSSSRRSQQAKARPVSPVYPQISQAIYKNVNEALCRAASPAGRAEEGGLARSTRRCRPSGGSQWKPPLSTDGGAPTQRRRSRGIPERRLAD